jgi:hypothetical protein
MNLGNVIHLIVRLIEALKLVELVLQSRVLVPGGRETGPKTTRRMSGVGWQLDELRTPTCTTDGRMVTSLGGTQRQESIDPS